jgi:NADH-quinone oxidoreductase subunit H
MPPLLFSGLLQVANAQHPLSTGHSIVASIVKLLIIFTVWLVTVALLTLAERRIAGWIQDRQGPNRVGPQGILQPAADGLKNFMKEETEPANAYRPIFLLAPAASFIPALVAWAVIPFAAPWPSPWGLVDMVLSDLPIGYLYVLAVSSLGAYGLILAGWSSNNKYALLGGLRASAQLISYEIALGMSIIPILLLTGNVTLSSFVESQAAGGFNWNILNLTVGFFIFVVAAFAETNRLPFDMPEAESELVAGYHTEYSSMKFSMFMISEFAAMLTISCLMVTLFFGGWDIPFTTWDNVAPWSTAKTLATLAAFMLKTGFFLFTFIWVRWTLPRFRYDQLMALGWRIMLPLAMAYIIIIAAAVLVLDSVGLRGGPGQAMALFGLNLVLLLVLFFIFDRGRLISPATARVGPTELARLRGAAQRATATAEAGD